MLLAFVDKVEMRSCVAAPIAEVPTIPTPTGADLRKSVPDPLGLAEASLTRVIADF
jgi:hypothetical protein